MSQEASSLIGQEIGSGDAQRYRIEDLIGSGGTGEVYVALDKQLGKRVALKLLRTHLSQDSNMRRHFEREVSLCTAIKSEHVVMVTDFGITKEGQPFYVMELLKGYTLRHLLKEKGRLSVEQTKQLAIQICDGLDHAHSGVNLWSNETQATELVRVIHCDLKPDNIFLVPTVFGDLVKILDFGIAKLQFQEHPDNATHISGGFWGTCRYAAPEQLEERQGIDERTDIYSLGMMLYEMLTGTDPFGLSGDDVTMMTWALAHTTKEPIPLKRQPHTDHIPKEMETIVMRCIEKDPAKRIGSVRELKAALLTVPDRAREGIKLPNWLWMGGAVVLALVGGMGVMGWWEVERHSKVLANLGGQFRYEECVKYSENLPYGNLPHKLKRLKDKCLLEWGSELGGNGLFQESFDKLLKIETPELRSDGLEQIDLFAATILAQGERAFQEGKGELAVVDAKVIPQQSIHFAEAQRLMKEWQQETDRGIEQMQKLKSAYRQGNWKMVVEIAACFPKIQVWQAEIKPIVGQAKANLGMQTLPPCKK
jgi:hypothetical protein